MVPQAHCSGPEQRGQDCREVQEKATGSGTQAELGLSPALTPFMGLSTSPFISMRLVASSVK